MTRIGLVPYGTYLTDPIGQSIPVRAALEGAVKAASTYTYGTVEVLKIEHDELIRQVGNFMQAVVESGAVPKHILEGVFPGLQVIEIPEPIPQIPRPPGIDDDDIPF